MAAARAFWPIAALLLGAERAIAVDYDPQALEATQANAEKNGVAGRLEICLPEQTPQTENDLLLANILAGPLIELASTLMQLIQPGAPFALSGITAGPGGTGQRRLSPIRRDATSAATGGVDTPGLATKI